jgi:hypothetical protein
MTTYRTVKTSYQQKEPLGQRIGGAMSAFGGMLNNLSKNAQQWDELKKKDELEAALKNQDKEFGDLVGGIYQGNALGDPGNVMSATDAKLPKPALPPTPPEEEAMFSIGGMSSPETSALQTSTPEQTPLTQPSAQQPESMLPNVPSALGGGQQEPQGADSAFKQMHEQRQMSKGIEKLRETVPDEDLKKIMAHTMKTAAIYRQYGNHEMAAKYQLGVLDMLQKQYGSDTSILKSVLANQLGKYRTDVGADTARTLETGRDRRLDKTEAGRNSRFNRGEAGKNARVKIATEGKGLADLLKMQSNLRGQQETARNKLRDAQNQFSYYPDEPSRKRDVDAAEAEYQATESDLNQLNSAIADRAGLEQAGATQAPERRLDTKSGKWALYDPSTKAFLRWE